MKSNQIKVNQLVTLNDLVDAQIRKVDRIEYPRVYVTWFEGTSQYGQWVDASLLKLASREQLAYAYQNLIDDLQLTVEQ